MRRPPDAVVLIARTHWVVGGTSLVSIALLHASTRNLPIDFAPATYVITGTFAAVYLAGGTLVWFGAPLGRTVSRVCGLLYLARPRLGSRLWEMMSSPEYQAHFGAILPKPPL